MDTRFERTRTGFFRGCDSSCQLFLSLLIEIRHLCEREKIEKKIPSTGEIASYCNPLCRPTPTNRTMSDKCICKGVDFRGQHLSERMSQIIIIAASVSVCANACYGLFFSPSALPRAASRCSQSWAHSPTPCTRNRTPRALLRRLRRRRTHRLLHSLWAIRSSRLRLHSTDGLQARH